MSEGPHRGRRWRRRARAARLTGSAVGATMAAAMPLFLLGALAVQVGGELGFDATGLGLAIAVFFLASVASGPLVFRVIERIGPRAGVAVTSALCAGALVIVAGVADGYGGLLAGMALGGVGQAFGQPSANGLLSRGLAGGRQGLAFGIKQTAVPATSLLAGAAVPLVALTVGWRWAYVGAAVLLAAVPLLVPRHAVDRAAPGSTSVGSAGSAGSAASVGSAASRPAGAAPSPAGERARPQLTPALGLLAIAGALAAAPTMTLSSFTVDSAVAHGVSEGAAGVLLAYGSAVSIAARLTGGALADRVGIDPRRTMAGLMALGAPAVALLGTATAPAALVVLVTVAFGAGWGWNGLMDLTVVRLNRAAPAAATSAMLTGFFAGAALGPLGFGVLVDAAGYGAAWAVAGGMLLVASGFVTVAGRVPGAAPPPTPPRRGPATR